MKRMLHFIQLLLSPPFQNTPLRLPLNALPSTSEIVRGCSKLVRMRRDIYTAESLLTKQSHYKVYFELKTMTILTEENRIDEQAGLLASLKLCNTEPVDSHVSCRASGPGAQRTPDYMEVQENEATINGKCSPAD